MCSYLVRRGATYYFRRSIPVDVRIAFKGRREWTVSLRTKDRPAAKRMIPHHLLDSDRVFDEARQAVGLEAPTIALTSALQAREMGGVADAPNRTCVVPAQPIADDLDGTMLDEEIVRRWAAERKVQKKGEDAHRAVARWLSIGVQKGPPIGVQKGPRLSSGVTGMAGVPFALVAA